MDEQESDLVFALPTFQAIVLMADAVQVTDGKLFILGGGLGIVGPRPQQISVAMRIGVPWDQANIKHQWELSLRDEDGQTVAIGEKPIAVNGQFEAGRPPGASAGTELWVPLGINFGPLQLAHGRRFVWRLSINGASLDHWKASFSVRAPEQQA